MERLTHKIVYDNEHCQYVFDIDQDSEVGTKLGELEDVLEEFELTSAEDLRNYLNFKGNMAIWEGKLELKNKIADLQHRLEVAEKALELACEELMGDLEFNGELDKHYNLQANIEYFKTKAREIVKSE